MITIKTPNTLIISIYGCLSSFSKQTHTLDDYIQKNLKDYLKKNWNSKTTQMIKIRLVRETQLDEDSGVVGVPKIPIGSKEKDVLHGMYENIKWRLNKGLSKGSPIHQLKDYIWNKGYANGTLKTHVYDDVAECLENWKYNLMIKLYSIALGDPTGQRLFLASTEQGDLTHMFNNYIIIPAGMQNDPAFYDRLLRILREQRQNLLFITGSSVEANAAQTANLQVILIDRKESLILNQPEPVQVKHAKKDGTEVKPKIHTHLTSDQKRPYLAIINSLREINFTPSAEQDCC